VFGVFVSDERVDGYHRLASPLVARRILAEWRAGSHPFLPAPEIARANAGGGLNLVITHFGAALALPDEVLYAVDYEAGRRVFTGWNLRTFTAEVFTRGGPFDARSWGENLGYRVGYYAPAVLRSAGIREEEAPCVWMATRKDVRGSHSVALAMLFALFSPPRCRFTQREQQSLLLALDGNTDEGIALALGVSNSTAKRLFRTIYEKTQDAIPDLELDGKSLAPGMRGAEIRRRLLNFVRAHPEELRPYDARERQLQRH
jgi:DNA-binding CsgD family transcriptional regulator